MTGDLELVVERDGAVKFVHDDRLAALFRRHERVRTRRASHVEPGEGGWTADLAPVGGPVLGPFRSRGAALRAEARWLSAALAAGRL